MVQSLAVPPSLLPESPPMVSREPSCQVARKWKPFGYSKWLFARHYTASLVAIELSSNWNVRIMSIYRLSLLFVLWVCNFAVAGFLVFCRKII